MARELMMAVRVRSVEAVEMHALRVRLADGRTLEAVVSREHSELVHDKVFSGGEFVTLRWMTGERETFRPESVVAISSRPDHLFVSVDAELEPVRQCEALSLHQELLALPAPGAWHGH